MIEAGRNLAEEKDNYKNLKTQLDEAVKKAGQTNDFREARGFLIEVQEAFKGVKMLREDRDELVNRLQDSFFKLANQMEAEKNQAFQEALQNYTILKVKVDEASFLASNSKDSGETWDYLLEVQAQFKNLRMQREHREALYGKLQEAFDKIKVLREHEKTLFDHESKQNFSQLNESVSLIIDKVKQNDDFKDLKEQLIGLQAEIRNVKLTRENRDELHSRIQDAFTMLHIKQDAFYNEKRAIAESQFQEFSERANDILARSVASIEFNQIRSYIKVFQAEMRDSAMLPAQKDSLRNIIQEAFETINTRQDQERSAYENEAAFNYNRLKLMVDDAMIQAGESNEYKETREYLKKIQAEFKGIKLIKEQREELYNRLQSAFELLNNRVDQYFREKKKNWEIRMQYKVGLLTTDIFKFREAVTTDLQNLKELEDFYQNITFSVTQETKAILGLRARIANTRAGIERKNLQISELEAELNDLQLRLSSDGAENSADQQ